MKHSICASMALSLAMAMAITMAGTAHAQDTASAPAALVVYDTALGAGWQNWSWAKTEVSVELNGSARRPIKVEAGAWQAMYLHHDAFSTTGYKQLGLLLQGSAPGGEVRVWALTDGKVNGEGHLVKIGNAGWTQVVVPLAELAAEDKLIDGIWVQNATAADLPKFYVTEIKLE